MDNDSVSVERGLERFFENVENNYPAAWAAFEYVEDVINRALSEQNLDSLIELISYIEEGEGFLAYQYIGDMHRILRILQVIDLERKYQKILFSTDCADKDALLEKYMISLYAFRRLLFHLSDTSVEEASLYLQKNKLSVYAVYTITQGDLISPDRLFYEKLMEIYSEFWNEEDVRLLYSLISST